MDVSCHRPFLPGTSLEVSCIESTDIFLVQLPNFSFSFSLLFQWLQLLLIQSYISASTFAVSLYINSYILTFFPPPFAQHFCLHVLSYLSVCLFLFIVFNYYIWPICCNFLSVCTAWFHNTVTSPTSRSGLGMCVNHFSVFSMPRSLHIL